MDSRKHEPLGAGNAFPSPDSSLEGQQEQPTVGDNRYQIKAFEVFRHSTNPAILAESYLLERIVPSLTAETIRPVHTRAQAGMGQMHTTNGTGSMPGTFTQQGGPSISTKSPSGKQVGPSSQQVCPSSQPAGPSQPADPVPKKKAKRKKKKFATQSFPLSRMLTSSRTTAELNTELTEAESVRFLLMGFT
jgi:hypothetical protein